MSEVRVPRRLRRQKRALKSEPKLWNSKELWQPSAVVVSACHWISATDSPVERLAEHILDVAVMQCGIGQQS